MLVLAESLNLTEQIVADYMWGLSNAIREKKQGSWEANLFNTFSLAHSNGSRARRYLVLGKDTETCGKLGLTLAWWINGLIVGVAGIMETCSWDCFDAGHFDKECVR